MELTSYRCDVCGRVKGEANHWFQSTTLPGPRFVIIPWNESMRDPNAIVNHLCGMECATKQMQEAMQGK